MASALVALRLRGLACGRVRAWRRCCASWLSAHAVYAAPILTELSKGDALAKTASRSAVDAAILGLTESQLVPRE
jgi:hypothetical protein